jgi:hypothetical protein
MVRIQRVVRDRDVRLVGTRGLRLVWDERDERLVGLERLGRKRRPVRPVRGIWNIGLQRLVGNCRSYWGEWLVGSLWLVWVQRPGSRWRRLAVSCTDGTALVRPILSGL